MRDLIITVILLLLSVDLLLAQDEKVLSQNVKISKNDLRTQENYLFHLKKGKRITDLVNMKVVKRYSNRTFVVTVEKDLPLEIHQQGDFYRIEPQWKLSPALKEAPPKEPLLLVLSTNDINTFQEKFTLEILQQYQNFLVVKATPQEFETLLNSPVITHISRYSIPHKEAPVTSLDLSVNQINRAHHLFPEVKGETTSVSIKELLFDTTDIDIRNRFDLIGTEANKVDQHATLIATLIAGAGNSGFTGAGIAPRSSISSSSFLHVFPDSAELFRTHDIFVQNHSYGTAPEAEYGIEAAAYDQQVYDLPQLVHVFSSGNSGLETPEEGRYEGVEGYSNLTGNFKMAKNIITVGAVDADKQPVSRSSKGPAHDGRIKPELVAYALAGTSDAAAMVSGTVLLLQDLYRKKEGHLPAAALVKAALVAGAEDVGPEGIDFVTGYGSLNAVESMKILDTHSFVEGMVGVNSRQSFSINIPAGTEEFKLVLSWTDLAGNPGDEFALVNDLDLELTGPSGEKWKPWVLDNSPHALDEKAVRARDSLNPVEMITVDSPGAGEYTVEVTGKYLSADQNFFLAYTSTPQSSFNWTYPTGSDALLLQGENVVRWETNLAAQNGVLEYRINESEWTVLDSSISLGSEKQTWVPKESGRAQLKFTIGANEYLSDIFSVSPEIKPRVLFNCDESLEISWEAVNGASEYQIQNLQDRYMETLFSTGDTSIELSKNDLESDYLSVVPVFGEISGRRGVTIDYKVQGVKCYYRNFFAFLSEEPKVEAVLNLSTASGIAEVQFQKEHEGEITSLTSFTPPFSELQLKFEDLLVQPGVNIYKATIILNDGSEVETDEVEFFLPGEETFTLYPNPIRSGESLHILSKGDGIDFEVFDLQGRRVIVDELLRFNDRIEINLRAPGVYIIRARRNGRTVGVRKLISH